MNDRRHEPKNSSPIDLRRALQVLAACAAPIVTGCSSEAASSGTGSVQLFVVPEETIPEGLTPGDGEENISDGWTIT
ncbi:MAG: hypothetical protein FJ096_20050 [Deltaproteobacteria bacterium]|nr:hypothetical protein [Deltaproteobacteria bacterium]